ncbi:MULTISPECIES: phosphoribosylaminoimidazolesuccinocarboxamide synthase [Listeria]|uniref:phosphoribosylaminoimidazolesuccinocarboxamide synthase n=1 Tax=Listeria TaxID=1637 RepID=UPI000B59773F|nr:MULTISPECIES: phosphoribosylaminoimidazolesuccinocarboxamide synthase [Listeria]
MTDELIYEGKAKELFTTEKADVLRAKYKDDATALNGGRKEVFAGKGIRNNNITSLIFRYLKNEGIPSHFIEQISETEQLIRKVDIIPLEVVVRNVLAGSLAKRLGRDEGELIDTPIVEFYFKNDALDDPFINDDHVVFLGACDRKEIETLKALAFQVNGKLQELFEKMGITLVDFKLEFGRDAAGQILLADEISPDTCRLWDKETRERLDKDVFRRNIGNLITVYDEVLSRLEEVMK